MARPASRPPARHEVTKLQPESPDAFRSMVALNSRRGHWTLYLTALAMICVVARLGRTCDPGVQRDPGAPISEPERSLLLCLETTTAVGTRANGSASEPGYSSDVKKPGARRLCGADLGRIVTSPGRRADASNACRAVNRGHGDIDNRGAASAAPIRAPALRLVAILLPRYHRLPEYLDNSQH